MDTPSNPEESVTDSCVQGDGEKAVDAQTSAGAGEGEKVIDSTTVLSIPPPPVAEADDRNEPCALATANLQTCAEAFTDAPTPLPFSCWDHKLSICVFWFFILAEVRIIPESFYYGL